MRFFPQRMSSGSQHTGCLKSAVLEAVHGTAIDVQRLPGHPGGVLTAQIQGRSATVRVYRE